MGPDTKKRVFIVLWSIFWNFFHFWELFVKLWRQSICVFFFIWIKVGSRSEWISLTGVVRPENSISGFCLQCSWQQGRFNGKIKISQKLLFLWNSKIFGEKKFKWISISSNFQQILKIKKLFPADFSSHNQHFAAVFLEPQQAGILSIPLILSPVSTKIRLRLFEGTRGIRLRICCDRYCPLETEKGLYRGHRSWMKKTVLCPPNTQMVCGILGKLLIFWKSYGKFNFQVKNWVELRR